jgi:Tol biopolymer transport system component
VLFRSHEKVRRITYDSSASQTFVDGPEISPDGSQVVYMSSQSATRGWEIRLVSSNGGGSQHVCWDAGFPHWIPPEGSRIGYVHLDPTVAVHGVEFRSVRPDGKDDRPEFLDTLSAGIRPFSFSYSPDGKSIVWIRNCRDSSFEEVVVHNLQTGKELQLTHDRKHIDEVCWGLHDQILFSSNRRGNVMVYMVSASGGDPVPLPVGGSEAMRISRDGKKLLCFHDQQIGHVWLARSDGSDARQLTHDETLAGEPFLSPDGKHIGYYVQDVDYMSGIQEIWVMDRDGKNPQKRTQLDSTLRRPLWSPDGRWIACFSQNNRGGDYHTHIVDPFGSQPPKPIGRGVPIAWRNNGEVMIFDSARTWIAPIDGKNRRQFYKDSTRAIPVLGGGYILYADWSKSRKGVWIVPTAGNSQPRQILPKIGEYPFIATNDRYHLYGDRGICWRVSLPGGKMERLPRPLPNLNGISIGPDGSEIVYVKQENRGKMTMYENMFK